jgi:hypothetical protein
MLGALLALPQEALHKRHMVYCLRQLAAPILVQPIDIHYERNFVCVCVCVASQIIMSRARRHKKRLLLGEQSWQ